jgi:hypothetical protein
VAWDVTQCAPVVQHHIIYGGGSQLPATLGGTYVTAGAMCGIGTTGVFTWLNAIDPSTDPTRFFWWLVVVDDGAGTEGSWGLDSGGLERSGPGPGGSSLMCGQVTKSVGNLCGR